MSDAQVKYEQRGSARARKPRLMRRNVPVGTPSSETLALEDAGSRSRPEQERERSIASVNGPLLMKRAESAGWTGRARGQHGKGDKVRGRRRRPGSAVAMSSSPLVPLDKRRTRQPAIAARSEPGDGRARALIGHYGTAKPLANVIHLPRWRHRPMTCPAASRPRRNRDGSGAASRAVSQAGTGRTWNGGPTCKYSKSLRIENSSAGMVTCAGLRQMPAWRQTARTITCRCMPMTGTRSW